MEKSSKKYPRISVKIILRYKDKALFYRTRKGVQDIPGGHIEFGETPIEALGRELREEIGFELPAEPKLLNVWSYITSDQSAQRIYIVYQLNVEKIENFVSLEYGDRIKFIWANEKEIKDYKLLPELEELFMQVLRPKGNENH